MESVIDDTGSGLIKVSFWKTTERKATSQAPCTHERGSSVEAR